MNPPSNRRFSMAAVSGAIKAALNSQTLLSQLAKGRAMYKHTYQVDHGAKAPDYLDAFFKNIHWETVATPLDNSVKSRSLWLAGHVR